jgi:uncharacterized protein (TIGR04255 family)
MIDTPNFANPPVVELVLGAQFSPMTKFTSGHFGLFWHELGDEWTEASDAPLLDDQFEQFDQPRWGGMNGVQLRLEPVRLPGRVMFGHRSGDRMIQIQPTRFHLNWRKREGFYPSYRQLIGEFEETFDQFSVFAERTGMGKPLLNQWELTYIDAFPKGEYWQTQSDWSTILPGLFGQLFPTDGLNLVLESRAAEWSYEMTPKRGRLHITAHQGRFGEDKREALLLNMTTRGEIGKSGAATLRAGLDVGHDAAMQVFLRVTSDDAKLRWGTKP